MCRESFARTFRLLRRTRCWRCCPKCPRPPPPSARCTVSHFPRTPRRSRSSSSGQARAKPSPWIPCWRGALPDGCNPSDGLQLPAERAYSSRRSSRLWTNSSRASSRRWTMRMNGPISPNSGPSTVQASRRPGRSRRLLGGGEARPVRQWPPPRRLCCRRPCPGTAAGAAWR